MRMDRHNVWTQILRWLFMSAFVVLGLWLLSLALGHASAANVFRSAPEWRVREGHLLWAGRFLWSSLAAFFLAVGVVRLLRKPRSIA